MKITSADVEAAVKELEEKDLKQIHLETAKTWLSRGLAAVRLADACGDDEDDERTAWLLDAEEYLHEALEHAALAIDGPLCSEPAVVTRRVKAILDLLPEA
jgi:hypothetical protein